MQTLVDLVPVATDMPAVPAEDDDGNAIEVAYDPNGTAAALVFKTISDQYGKYSVVKVVRGKIKSDMSLVQRDDRQHREARPPVCHEGQEGRGGRRKSAAATSAPSARWIRSRPATPSASRKTYVKSAPMAFAPALLQPSHRPQDEAGDREARHRVSTSSTRRIRPSASSTTPRRTRPSSPAPAISRSTCCAPSSRAASASTAELSAPRSGLPREDPRHRAQAGPL